MILHRVVRNTLTTNVRYGKWLIGFRKQEDREGREKRRKDEE